MEIIQPTLQHCVVTKLQAHQSVFLYPLCFQREKLPHLYVTHFLFLFISRMLARRQQKKNLISFLLYTCGNVSKAQNNN